MLDAKRFQESTLHGAAGGGDDLHLQVLRDLDRCHSHTTGPRMNENGFTGSHSGDVLKGVPGSHEDDWQRGRLIEGKIRRNAPDIPGSRERMGGDTKCGDRKDAVPW